MAFYIEGFSCHLLDHQLIFLLSQTEMSLMKYIFFNMIIFFVQVIRDWYQIMFHAIVLKTLLCVKLLRCGIEFGNSLRRNPLPLHADQICISAEQFGLIHERVLTIWKVRDVQSDFSFNFHVCYFFVRCLLKEWKGFGLKASHRQIYDFSVESFVAEGWKKVDSLTGVKEIGIWGRHI